MFDMNVVGDIFAAPDGYAIFEGIKRLSQDGPVLLGVAESRRRRAQRRHGYGDGAGRRASRAQRALLRRYRLGTQGDGGRSGARIGGMLFYSKIIGAMAERGASMDAMIRMFERVRDRTRTISVAVTNCTHPVSELAMFSGLGVKPKSRSACGVHAKAAWGGFPCPPAGTWRRCFAGS